MTASIGVVHGRFQPLHLGHLEYLLAGADACEMLIVGITNPDPEQVRFEPSDPARGEPAANPFTYFERLQMVDGALVDAGLSRRRFRIVPFPHSTPQRLAHYAPRDALYLLTIYDAWGETKLARFAELGLATQVLWRRETKVTSGSEIRQKLTSGEPWEHLVPPATAAVIRDVDLDQRYSTITH
jgi:cytidyltransferase-like protein